MRLRGIPPSIHLINKAYHIQPTYRLGQFVQYALNPTIKSRLTKPGFVLTKRPCGEPCYDFVPGPQTRITFDSPLHKLRAGAGSRSAAGYTYGSNIHVKTYSFPGRITVTRDNIEGRGYLRGPTIGKVSGPEWTLFVTAHELYHRFTHLACGSVGPHMEHAADVYALSRLAEFTGEPFARVSRV